MKLGVEDGLEPARELTRAGVAVGRRQAHRLHDDVIDGARDRHHVRGARARRREVHRAQDRHRLVAERGRTGTVPMPLRPVCVAIFEVARRLLYRPASEELVLDKLPPVRSPRLDPGSAMARMAVVLSEETAQLLQILVAAELERNVISVFRELAGDWGQSGMDPRAVLAVAAGMGIPEPVGLRALAPGGPLDRHGFIQWFGEWRRVAVPRPVLRQVLELD
ncbi:MAG: hypothetical protein L0027_14555 [Candidatus Rokubacteria bacterium]|nr:hypothetical protein [Candidatus Rokubacteria bacterium]